MRLGKTQKEILKFMYRNERGGTMLWMGRRLEGLNSPTKFLKKQRIIYPKNANSNKLKIREVSRALTNGLKTSKELKNLLLKSKEFHKKSTSVFRSYKLLQEKKLIENLGWGYRLTELGRRVISHR